MQTRFYIIAGLAVVLSFLGGFWLANSLNKSEIAALSINQKNPEGANPGAITGADLELPDEEIKQKLKEAQENPGNFSFQKGLGLALYRYAASKKDPEILNDVEVLLKRAHGLNPHDYEVLVSLGNVNYDLGRLKKEANRIDAAREFYKKALEKNPKDANVITDLGYSYLESENPQPEKAAAYLEDAYLIDPRSERVLASLSFAYLKLNDSAKVGKYVEELKKVNPKNPDIAQIELSLKSEALQ